MKFNSSKENDKKGKKKKSKKALVVKKKQGAATTGLRQGDILKALSYCAVGHTVENKFTYCYEIIFVR